MHRFINMFFKNVWLFKGKSCLPSAGLEIILLFLLLPPFLVGAVCRKTGKADPSQSNSLALQHNTFKYQQLNAAFAEVSDYVYTAQQCHIDTHRNNKTFLKGAIRTILASLQILVLTY